MAADSAPESEVETTQEEESDWVSSLKEDTESADADSSDWVSGLRQDVESGESTEAEDDESKKKQ